MRPLHRAIILVALAGAGCMGQDPTGLGPAAPGTGPQVRFDVRHLPFPEIPLPNNFATRYDATSPTGLRLNASVLAGTTDWERATRRELDKLTGWGTLAPITVSFTAPLDVEPIYQRHHQDPPDFSDDAVLVIDVTPDSPDYCGAVPLDLGQGNYPLTLPDTYEFPADPRAGLQQIEFEEVDEDANHDGVLDPGEDTDMDGVLDHPNTRDGQVGGEVMDFYERETNTLIMKPMVPMREATTYAVVLTRRLVGADGAPVRSPFPTINATAQTSELGGLGGCLDRYGLGMSDVAFTWSFTTQSLTSDYERVRDGLHGLGPMADLATSFPATVSKLYDVATPGAANLEILPADTLLPLIGVIEGGQSAGATQTFTDNWKFIDYTVVGEVPSPQFFPRQDADGNPLPLYDQVWDLAAPPRSEPVSFWLFVPKNRTGPAPVAIFIHGHGGSKFDALTVAGAIARYGIATLSIDAPSHGIGVDATTKATYDQLFHAYDLDALEAALFDANRAIDWNGDGVVDSGADYWTSYVFHTRDEVRQTMVDVMQVVRMLHGFDGQARWDFDPADTGSPGLAGDFDGDGQVDVGGAAPISLVGGSLGGITGALAAGVEPDLDTVVSIVPGGMLGGIGARSSLGGVKTAMVLRMIGPLFYSTGGTSATLMTAVNDAQTNEADLAVHALPALAEADTVVLTDLRNGEYRCGAVQADGSFRVAVPSDQGDPLQLRAYAGPLPPKERIGCEIPDGATPTVTIDSLDRDVQVGGASYASGSPLIAISDGFGLRRSTPELRRMLGLAQIALDSADPMNFAPYWEGHRTLTYGNGDTVGTHVWLIPSNGDPGVCIANGIALARAAGFVPYDVVDPRWGKSENQVLIDTYTTEGVSRVAHYQDGTGQGVLMDVSNLASITGADDGYDVPRLDPAMRSTAFHPEQGGSSGALIVMLSPQGKHGFVTPDPDQPFDMGTLLIHMIGRYLATDGHDLTYDACQVTASCPWIPPVMN